MGNWMIFGTVGVTCGKSFRLRFTGLSGMGNENSIGIFRIIKKQCYGVNYFISMFD